MSDHHIAAFSLYLACFDKKLFFKDVRIANELNIKKKEWETMIRDLRKQLQFHMEIPSAKLEYDVLRVATKKRINEV